MTAPGTAAAEVAAALDEVLRRLDGLTAASSATGYDGRVVRATGVLLACAAELVQAAAAAEPDGPTRNAGAALCSAIDGLEHVLRRLRWVRSVHVGRPRQDVRGKEKEVP